MRIAVLDGATGTGLSAPGYFSRHTIAHLRAQGHEVSVGPFDSSVCRSADLVWTEWCDEQAVRASRSGDCKRLVLRLRGYEVFSDFFDRVLWDRVSALVPESPFLEELAREARTDLPLEYPIPGGVDLSTFAFVERGPGPVVAAIGRVDPAKGWQLLTEWARQRPDLEIHAAIALQQHAPRFVQYLRYVAPMNLEIVDEVDTAAWLTRLQPNYYVSMSTMETLGYTIAEAMAMGIRPLIHDSPGNAVNWTGAYLWRSLDQLNAVVGNGGACARYDSGEYRKFVEDHLDARRCAKRFESFLRDVEPPRSAQVSAPAVIRGAVQEPPSVLFLGRSDWANISNRLARAFNTAAGREVARVCTLNPHPSGYREDMVIEMGTHRSLFDMAAEADWLLTTGDGAYSWFSDMANLLPLDDRCRFGVLHVGTAYRNEPEACNRNDTATSIRFLGSDLYRLRGDGGPTAFPFFAPPHAITAAQVTHEPGSPIVIAHSPTARHTKGTDEILQVLSELQAKYPRIEIVLLENMPFDVCSERRARAHIVVDQVSDIGGFGTTAVEALATGQVVLASMQNIDPAVWSYYDRPPIMEARTPDELRSLLDALITHPDEIAVQQAESLAWARKWATPEALAAYWWGCLASV